MKAIRKEALKDKRMDDGWINGKRKEGRNGKVYRVKISRKDRKLTN